MVFYKKINSLFCDIRKYQLLTVGLLLVVATAMSYPLHTVSATSEAFSGGANFSATVGIGHAISDLSISGTGNDTIDLNLYVPNGTLAMSTTAGLTFSSSQTGNNLQFSGTRTDINSALATLSYKPPTEGTFTIEATIGGSGGEVYNTANGHVYKVVYAPGGINWDDAYTAALAQTYNGATGYLATVTSQDESDFIVARLQNDGWIGANDKDNEGDWKWVGGDENGTSFWSGGPGGSSVNDAFVHWHGGSQPDNAGNEDCGQIVIGQGGVWNDLPCTSYPLEYYVVEFGTSGNPVSIASETITATATLPQFGGGDGSSEDPYQISDCEQLQSIDFSIDRLTKSYILNNDIDCSMTNPSDDDFSQSGMWSDEAGFMPIGQANGFGGNLEGAGYSINDLYINRPDDSQVGLFSVNYEGSLLHNVSLANVDITGGDATGALVGVAYGTMNNCSSSGEVTGDDEVGGLIGGHNGWDTIRDSSSSVNVHGDWSVGGIAGSNYGNIHSSYATGDVHGTSSVGGLAGYSNGETTIDEYSYATGDVFGEQTVGGLVGEAYGAFFQDVYATGDVHQSGEEGQNFGGLIGYGIYIPVNHAYALGDVIAESGANVGGLLGAGVPWLEQTAALGDVSGGDSVGGLVGMINCFGAPIVESFSRGHVTSAQNGGGFGSSIQGCSLSDSFTQSSVAAAANASGFANVLGDIAVANAYSAAPLSGEESTNGFVHDYSTGEVSITNSFWDQDLAQTTDSSDAIPETTDDMKTETNYTDVGWDFVETWSLDEANNNGYPCLQWAGEACANIQEPTLDDDNDGTATEVENAAPNNGDANNDGTPDSEQANVTSFPNALTGTYTVLETSCTSNFNVQNGGESSESKDAAYDYVAGLIGFVGQNCGNPGATVTVKLYYYGSYNPADFVLRKWADNTYTTITGASLTQTTIGGQPVLIATYQIVDGGLLDQDGLADGNIVDPAGLGKQVVGAPNTGLGGQRH